MAKKQSQAKDTSRLAWQERARVKIQASQVLNRLIKHSLSDEDIMSVSQVNAARSLVNKTLPDLKAMELTGEGGGAIEFSPVEALAKVKKAIESRKP